MRSYMENSGKVTIKDVAKRAGVSKGTVDRVLHNRGEVSPRSKERVRKAIQALGYEPNIYASMLASTKERTVATLLPSFEPGEYWDKSARGVAQAAEMAKPFNVWINSFPFDQNNLDSFKAACERVLRARPSGVVLAPIFPDQTRLFAQTLAQEGIPYVFIDSCIEDANYLAYFGMQPYQSGCLCADMLTLGKDPGHVVVVRVIRDKSALADPTLNRREGFKDYMAQHYPACEIRQLFINPHSPEDCAATLHDFFCRHPHFRHIAVFNSRVHLIAPYLAAHSQADRRVVAYDDLELNLAALQQGLVQMLITQHAEQQSYLAIKTLVDYLVLKKAPEKRDNNIHMDLLTRFNID